MSFPVPERIRMSTWLDWGSSLEWQLSESAVMKLEVMPRFKQLLQLRPAIVTCRPHGLAAMGDSDRRGPVEVMTTNSQ